MLGRASAFPVVAPTRRIRRITSFLLRFFFFASVFVVVVSVADWRGTHYNCGVCLLPIGLFWLGMGENNVFSSVFMVSLRGCFGDNESKLKGVHGRRDYGG